MRKIKWLLLLCLISAVIVSCEDNPPPTLPPATPGGGFIIATIKSENGAPPVADPGVTIDASWVNDLPGAAGNASPLAVTTNGLGLAPAVGARAPARWNFTWVSAPDDSAVCDGQSQALNVPLNDIVEVGCAIFTVGESLTATVSSFAFAPNPVYTLAAPGSGTILGQGLTTTYGMPLVQYYTLDGTFVGQENATSVSSGGTSMQISGFNISQLPGGTYAGLVSNAASGGAYNYVGTGAVKVVVGGAPGTGTVTMTGYEQSMVMCLAPQPATSQSASAPQPPTSQSASPQVTCPTIYDYGTVSITVNGFAKSVSYARYSTNSTIATGLASAFNADSASPVTATASGAVVSLKAKVGGSASNYPISATAMTEEGGDFASPSFTPTPSGSWLTGGTP